MKGAAHMKRILALGIIAPLTLSGCAKLKAYNALPDNQKVLFWPQERRDAAFLNMEKLGPVRTIPAAANASPLIEGETIKFEGDIDSIMKAQHMAGIIVLRGGKIRFEHYGLGLSRSGRWTSFSVAKSITSTLVGAALRDGAIKSLDDKVTAYLPEMAGSAYDDVTIRHLLTMTSGVKWTENYTDPHSDVAQFITQKAEPGIDVTVSYMRKLKREAPPGTKWVYKTGETNLAGVLVSRAVGKPLSAYLSEKIWKPFGMEQDALWLLGDTSHEISGCCLSASLRDYARFGQFMLGGGKAAGQKVMPDDWVAQATTKQYAFPGGGNGYGFFWWTLGQELYAARGIFGQSIFIDPKRNSVIVILGDWPKASATQEIAAGQTALLTNLVASLDKEIDQEKAAQAR
jgi:CubicO group peptidase (beta-lactamase class C family)